jgi:hypothetical protein
MNKSFVEGLKPSRLFTDPEEMRRVVGWTMKAEDAFLFFRKLQKRVISLFGYSSPYEDEGSMLKIVREELSRFSPETHLVNIGATMGGIGAAYPLAKSMGFLTTGIVSSLATQYADQVSADVAHICFIADTSWGGKLPNSDALAPTSQAMVACTDIFIGIGGGEITRDELRAGQALGKPVTFHPAEVNHEWARKRAEKNNQPPPTSFWGPAHAALIGDSAK